VTFKALVPLLPLTLLAHVSQASEQLEEILVTAELRATSLMASTTSTSVVDGDMITQRAAQQLEEILNMAPNVNFAGGTSRARYFQIRGVGDRSQFQEPLNPSVGVLIDGVDFSGIGSVGTLFDVSQVEVLRGPQGTLHGANALAGLVNVRANAPTEQAYHYIEAGAGNYDTYNLGAISSGPISQALQYRVAVQQFASDGYQDNDFTGRDDTADRDELTLRTKLRWLASARHQLDLAVTYIDIDNGYDAFSLDNTRTTLSDQPGEDAQQSLALSLHSQSGFRHAKVQGLLSYATSDSRYSYDEDWTFEGFDPDGYTSFDQYDRARDSISAEVRALSNERSRLFGGRSDWVVGLYYLGNEEALDRTYTFAPFFTSENNTDTFAVFGQLDTALDHNLTLVTGLRWERRETQYADNNAVALDPDDDLWGGKLALEYQWSDNAMAYAAVSRGYRANGVNASILSSINATDDPAVVGQLRTVQAFDSESLVNYELGLKSRFADNTVQARIALFYMDRQDQQVRGAFLVPQDGGATTFIDYTSNAAQGNNYGAEVEVDWLATQALRVWANLGLLETEFDEYLNVFGEDLSGREQAQAPSYQYSTGGRYTFAGGAYVSLALEGKDAFYFSDRHDEQADAFHLVNASVGFERDQWTLQLWARNLTDEDYYVRGFGSFGNDPRNGYATEPYYQFGEPRVWGATVGFTF
jgi:outer membrane receptor protein involved in Fe transport